jgi:uncharacterized protein YuzE
MIRQKYDLEADALYIRITDRKVAYTDQVDPGTLIDFDDTDSIIGLEVIHPYRRWPLDLILERFDVSEQDARELRAYFPQRPQTNLQPAHLAPGLLQVAASC